METVGIGFVAILPLLVMLGAITAFWYVVDLLRRIAKTQDRIAAAIERISPDAAASSAGDETAS